MKPFRGEGVSSPRRTFSAWVYISNDDSEYGASVSGENSQTMVIYAVLVLFLMIGAGGLGLMSIVLDNGEKEYTLPHDYIVDSGTYLGVDADGTGTSKYLNESQREYLYHFVTTLSNGEVVFDVICDSEKIPISELYTKGEAATIGDVQCTWWSYSPDNMVCSFAIDEKMVVHQYIVSAQDGTWSFTGNLNDS